jgi:hypothetical protein
MKDINPGDWMYYRAWLVLKEHVSFMPPKERDAIDLEEEEDTEEEENVPTDVLVPNESPNDLAIAAIPSASDASAVSSVHRGRARGPGPGRKKTKLDSLQAKYMEKKMANMDAMVSIAKAKAKDLKRFVRNNTHTNACKMAYMGYHGTKNAQLKRKYEKRMKQLMDQEEQYQSSDDDEAEMDGNADGDANEAEAAGDDDDLPPLTGV